MGGLRMSGGARFSRVELAVEVAAVAGLEVICDAGVVEDRLEDLGVASIRPRTTAMNCWAKGIMKFSKVLALAGQASKRQHSAPSAAGGGLATTLAQLTQVLRSTSTTWTPREPPGSKPRSLILTRRPQGFDGVESGAFEVLNDIRCHVRRALSGEGPVSHRGARDRGSIGWLRIPAERRRSVTRLQARRRTV